MSGSFIDPKLLPKQGDHDARLRESAATPVQAAVKSAHTFKLDVLSKREREVCNLIASAVTNKDAAAKLFVTEKTIKYHLTNIYKKLGVKSRAELIVTEAAKRAHEKSASQIA